ncbi:MAG: 2-oxo acid dehydrogenase subunit E2, partial [Rhodospirillaceae bacterium]
TDKATMEMEAVDEGVLGKILVEAGTEDVAVNQPIGVLLEEGEDKGVLKGFKPKGSKAGGDTAKATDKKSAQTQKESESLAQEPKERETATKQASEAQPSVKKGGRTFASPLAKRLAAEAGLDLSSIQGSGPNGRIIKADVERASREGSARAASAGKTTAPSGAVSDFGQPYSEVPNSGMRKTIARRLVEAKSTIPHFYLTIDCRIDELLAARKDINRSDDGGFKISVNDFVIKASALALRKIPQANATWTEEAIRLYEDVDISVAVATPEGLITPIVRHADKKSLGAISTEVKDLAE